MGCSRLGEESERRWLAFVEAVAIETEGEEELLRGKLPVQKLGDDGCR